MTTFDTAKNRQKTIDLIHEVTSLPLVPIGSGPRAEFQRLMTDHYMRDQFKAVRKNSKQFGDNGMPQRILASLMGVDATWVSNFENGRIDNPGLKTLMRYAEALGGALEVCVVRHSYFPNLNAEHRGHHPDSYIPTADEEAEELGKHTMKGMTFTR